MKFLIKIWIYLYFIPSLCCRCRCCWTFSRKLTANRQQKKKSFPPTFIRVEKCHNPSLLICTSLADEYFIANFYEFTVLLLLLAVSWLLIVRCCLSCKLTEIRLNESPDNFPFSAVGRKFSELEPSTGDVQSLIIALDLIPRSPSLLPVLYREYSEKPQQNSENTTQFH